MLTELLSTGGKDAAKIAAYSAIGVILRELVAGLFEEIRATFKNKGESLKEIFVIEKLLLSVPALTPIMAFPVPIINETIGTILSTTLSAIIGGLLSTIAIYYMDKWASGKKESNLQIQIMTKSGEVANLKLQETWLVLWDGYDAVLGGAGRTISSIEQLRNTINKHKGNNNE